MHKKLNKDFVCRIFALALFLWVCTSCGADADPRQTAPSTSLPPNLLQTTTTVISTMAERATAIPTQHITLLITSLASHTQHVALAITPFLPATPPATVTPSATMIPSATLYISPTIWGPAWVTSTTLIVLMKPLAAVSPTPDATKPLPTTESMTPTVTLTPTLTVPATPVPSPVRQPTPDNVARTAKVPILMYHYLSEPPANADIVRKDLSVSPALFTAQLDRMQAEGYTTISLYDLVANLTQGAALPPKPVVITFDDGYRDSYENAFPILQAHGMKATFFIVTDFIDNKRPEYLSWDMVRTMYAAGMSIESHSRNHVSLRRRDKDYLVWQALGSLQTIQAELGVASRFICYPAGEYDQKTIDIFKSANYWAGITTIQGATHKSDDLFELRRVRIRGTTTPDQFARLLALDW